MSNKKWDLKVYVYLKNDIWSFYLVPNISNDRRDIISKNNKSENAIIDYTVSVISAGQKVKFDSFRGIEWN